MSRLIKISVYCILLILCGRTAESQVLRLEGQVIGWGAASHSDYWYTQLGGRYLPEFKFNKETDKLLSFEGEFSLNASGSWTNPSEGDKFYGRVKPYRAWLKIGSDQFELRAGLQKINFGSATMLRSLMWFDRIDPRDPLQLTDGVYGLLGRYYFLNNTNIWIWGLYGNRGTKGWDYLESDYKRPEFGGRLQLPVPGAEFAISYHNRNVNDDLESLNMPTGPLKFNEQKFSFDIKADLLLGLWAEGVVKLNNTSLIPKYQKMVTLGADYTFGLGNGLMVSMEYLGVATSERLSSENVNNLHFLGTSVNYPLSIISGVSAILYLNPDTGDMYRFVSLSLSYDRFSFYFMGFWNPTDYQLLNLETESNIYSGTGINVMAVFSY